MTHLRASGIVVHLDLSVQQLKKRLEDVHALSVVIAEGQTIECLFSDRRPRYLKFADYTIAMGCLTADQIVEVIVAGLKILCDITHHTVEIRREPWSATPKPPNKPTKDGKSSTASPLTRSLIFSNKGGAFSM